MQIRTWNFLRTVTVATAIGALLAYGVSLFIPKHYVSNAVIGIDISKTENGPFSILSLSQRVLSREALTKIISNRGLFQTDRPGKPNEELVERMRNSVQLQPMRSTKGELVAFAVNYVSDSPVAAQSVNQDLVAGFIEENFRSRPGEAIRMVVIDPSSLPKTSSGHPSWIVPEGLIAGLLAGLVIGIVRLVRKPASTA